MDLIANIREYIDFGPGSVAFKYITDAINKCDDPDMVDVALNYANQHMAEWPDSHRYLNVSRLNFWGLTAPSFPLVRSLFITEMPPNQFVAVKSSIKSRNVFNLTHLSVHCGSLTNQDFAAIVDTHWLRSLKSLKLRGQLPRRNELFRLFQGCLIHQLESLSFSNSPMGAESTYLLSAAKSWGSLKELKFTHAQLIADDVWTLTHNPHFAQIERLDLYENNIGRHGAVAIAESPHAANLTYLDIRANQITDEGINALANSPYLANLKTLGIGKISKEGARAIWESPHLNHWIKAPFDPQLTPRKGTP